MMESLEAISQKTRKAYNEAAEKYQQLFYDELDKKEFDRKFLDDFSTYFNSDSIICDLGCGPCGHVANYLSKKGLNLVGIDISERCVEISRKNYPAIKFEEGDFSKLNFSDNYFDGIISFYSIVDTPKKYIVNVLKEFKRVLKKGGYFLLAVKEGNNEGFQRDLLGIEAEIYFSLFTESEIKIYLSEGGFEIVKIEQRIPYPDEINLNRIYSISRKN